ncbi:MAG: hypothetical protein U1F44_02400 [Coriobacteriia bacterium]|nr:hypothetical protein [Coriobacteriia bacterium]
MSLWVTLASAFRFTRRSARLWPIGILAMLGSAPLAVIHVEGETPLFASNEALRVWLAERPATAIAVTLGVLVGVVGLWLLSELATAALVIAADAPLQHHELSAGEAWRGGRRVWRRVVAVDVLVVVPALVPFVTLAALGAAALDTGAVADVAERLLDFLTAGIYSGFAVLLAIVVWAWRDLAVRHAVLGGERPMEAVHAAVSDLTGTFARTLAVGAALFITSWLVTFVLLLLLFALDAFGLAGVVSLTPALAWQWIILPGAVLLGPYALFDVSAWTYWYRLNHPAVTEVTDVE